MDFNRARLARFISGDSSIAFSTDAIRLQFTVSDITKISKCSETLVKHVIRHKKSVPLTDDLTVIATFIGGGWWIIRSKINDRMSLIDATRCALEKLEGFRPTLTADEESLQQLNLPLYQLKADLYQLSTLSFTVLLSKKEVDQLVVPIYRKGTLFAYDESTNTLINTAVGNISNTDPRLSPSKWYSFSN